MTAKMIRTMDATEEALNPPRLVGELTVDTEEAGLELAPGDEMDVLYASQSREISRITNQTYWSRAAYGNNRIINRLIGRNS